MFLGRCYMPFRAHSIQSHNIGHHHHHPKYFSIFSLCLPAPCRPPNPNSLSSIFIENICWMELAIVYIVYNNDGFEVIFLLYFSFFLTIFHCRWIHCKSRHACVCVCVLFVFVLRQIIVLWKPFNNNQTKKMNDQRN